MATVEEIYSVILTNYNNEKYIKIALDSIFSQDYPNIQLIITDDGSNSFNKEKLEKYIYKNKNKNIKQVEFILNKKNIGTVKTLNKAIKKAIGEYIIFFASDDKLANEKVLSNFAKAFKNKKRNIITSQWKICDENLEFKNNYVSKRKAQRYNLGNIKKQYFCMCKSNLYGSGATSYRKSIFQKYGYIDEKYRLLEDWPFWLHLIFEGEKIYYKNFDGLLHRTGGVSQNNNTSSITKQFYYEILSVFRCEIIPTFDRFNVFQKVSILRRYKYNIDSYGIYIDTSKELKNFKSILNNDKKLKFFWYLNKFNPYIGEKLKILWKWNIEVSRTMLVTLLLCFFVLNRFNLNNNQLLFSYIITYLFVYIWMCMSVKIYRLIKRKK